METTETLEQGMYCEATNEQIAHLYEIEGETPSIVTAISVSDRTNRNVWWDSKHGLILSEIIHGNHITQLPFADFRQRLINTVNNK